MPELVACPSCGCKVQAAEMLLGSRTRCIACGHQFVAQDEQSLPPPGPAAYPLGPSDTDEDSPPQRPEYQMRGPARHRMPLCPRCHRPVSWDDLACLHCGHLFDPEDRSKPVPFDRRRDAEAHRGQLIDKMGNICLLCAALGPCSGGITLLAAFGTGLPALALAGYDLARMNRKELDDSGRSATEMGRNKAVVGLIMAVVFTIVLVLLCMEMIR